jgi:hypothetical protein
VAAEPAVPLVLRVTPWGHAWVVDLGGAVPATGSSQQLAATDDSRTPQRSGNAESFQEVATIDAAA